MFTDFFLSQRNLFFGIDNFHFSWPFLYFINLFCSIRFDIGKSMAGMHHDDFHKLAAKYKFTLAMENAICDDYVTEKLWRPLRLGSVPIVFGSPKVKVEI